MTKEKIILLCVYVIVSILSSVLVIVIRKRPVSNELDKVMKNLLLVLPIFVYDAETLALNGPEKLQYVIDKSLDYLKKRISLSDAELETVTKTIINEVELILCTPRKKEINK